MKTIAVVDDDEAVRQSICTLIRSEGLKPSEFAEAHALIAALEEGAEFSCVVSDIMMPGMSGLDLQRALRAHDPKLPLILITGHGKISMAVKAIQDGAADFIEKPFDADDLIGSIRRAVEEAGRKAEAEHRRARVTARIGELTKRQREVMDFVVQGLSSKEIAVKLGISHRTVETYRLWIMERMEARNLADLVRMAMLIDRTDEA